MICGHVITTDVVVATPTSVVAMLISAVAAGEEDVSIYTTTFVIHSIPNVPEEETCQDLRVPDYSLHRW